MGICQSVTSRGFVARRPEFQPVFDRFLALYCTVGDGRYVPRSVLQAAFARYLHNLSVDEPTFMAAAALDFLCEERGFTHSGTLLRPSYFWHAVAVMHETDTRVTTGLSLDSFPLLMSDFERSEVTGDVKRPHARML